MNDIDTLSLLTRAVNGDVDAFIQVMEIPHAELSGHEAMPLTFVVTVPAVERVLAAWESSRVSEVLVQRWASFVRSGFVGRPGIFPVKPLDNEFDPQHEEQINDAVGRLDEIGDVIDGEPTVHKVRALLNHLVGNDDQQKSS